MSTTTTWPGGTTDPTPTAYAVPSAGELNWQALSNFLNALASSAQGTSFQKFAVRKATSSPVTVSATTDCVVVTNLSVAGAVTVNLPAGANKQVFVVVDDKGDAATNNITINRNGSDTIAGATTAVLATNREAIILIYNSSDTDWKIAGRMRTTVNLTSGVSGVLPTANGGTGQNSSATFPTSATNDADFVMKGNVAQTIAGTKTFSGLVDASASAGGIKLESARSSPAVGDSQNFYSFSFTPTFVTSSNTGSLTSVSFGAGMAIRMGAYAILAFRLRPVTSGTGSFTFRINNPFTGASNFSNAESAAGTWNTDGGTSGTIGAWSNNGTTQLIFSSNGGFTYASTDFYGTIVMKVQ